MAKTLLSDSSTWSWSSS